VLGGSGGGTNIDQTSTLKVQCTNTTTYDIGLDEGTTASATTAQRLLFNGATSETIKYNLFTDAGHSTVWGKLVGTDTVHATGSGAQQTYTIYGRVPGQNTPTPGTYTDTVHITVTY
jgi:spore coat protein U-like protein